jgi:hypothetical protein
MASVTGDMVPVVTVLILYLSPVPALQSILYPNVSFHFNLTVTLLLCV